MDALKLLETQHKEVKAAFKDYEDAENKREKLHLFKEIADMLAAHATIEEKILYPAAYGGDRKDLLKEAVEEHLAAKRLIADLLVMKASDDNFDAKVKVLQEQIEHHVKEEEHDLFKDIKKDFPEAKLETLGQEMETLFDELMKGSPRNDVPNETEKAAPLK